MCRTGLYFISPNIARERYRLTLYETTKFPKLWPIELWKLNALIVANECICSALIRSAEKILEGWKPKRAFSQGLSNNSAVLSSWPEFCNLVRVEEGFEIERNEKYKRGSFHWIIRLLYWSTEAVSQKTGKQISDDPLFPVEAVHTRRTVYCSDAAHQLFIAIVMSLSVRVANINEN